MALNDVFLYDVLVNGSFSLKHILLPLKFLIALSFLFTVPAADFSDLDFNHSVARKSKSAEFFKLLVEDTDGVVKRSQSKVVFFPFVTHSSKVSVLPKTYVSSKLLLPVYFLLAGDVKARAPPVMA